MKSQEQLEKFRAMNIEDLRSAISSTEEELMKLRFRHAAGQLEHTAQLTSLKKQVARAKTILTEKVAVAAAGM